MNSINDVENVEYSMHKQNSQGKGEGQLRDFTMERVRNVGKFKGCKSPMQYSEESGGDYHGRNKRETGFLHRKDIIKS